MKVALGSVSLIVLIVLGIAVLWSIRLAFSGRGALADNPIRLILTIAGWTLILVGILGAVTHLLMYVSPLGWLVVLATIVMAVTRYRTLESRSLLWSLSVAAKKGIPLNEAATALAEERADEMGIRAARLAYLLEAGVPLPVALHDSRTSLPTDALVAVRLGTASGDLGSALAYVTRPSDELDDMVRSNLEKLFYLGLVISFVVVVLAFLMLKIVPVFAKMFEEFDLELPAATQLVVAMAGLGVRYGFLCGPLLVAFLAAFLIGVAYYVGWLPRDVPLLNRLTLRYDGALVMRSLAFAVRSRRPLGQTIETLAQLYPKAGVRSRLFMAGVWISEGQDWCESLLQAGLIKRADAAVLKAAERVGNLDWALEEMADSAVRRLAYRMRFWLHVLFPAVLLVLGVLIALVVIGLFVPLVSLIQGLA